MVGDNLGQEGPGELEKEFSLEQVCLRKLSFDAPKLAGTGKKLDMDMDNVDVKLNTYWVRFLEDHYSLDVLVEAHVTCEGKSVFEASVYQVGVFRVVGYTEEDATTLLQTSGLEQVYPYIRELIQSLASRCGIQRLSLPVIAGEIRLQ